MAFTVLRLSYLDSLSADSPPFPVVEFYYSGDVKRGGGHAAPSFTPFQSSSLTELWLLTDRSTPVSSTVDVQRYGIPEALRPSSSIVGLPPSWSSSLTYAMVAERPEYYSFTTVDVQGHAVPAPGFAPFQSPSRRMAGGRQEHASLTTVDVQGHDVSTIRA